MTYVFLDVETTGLNPARHEVWEIAYAVDDGPVECSTVPHSTTTADLKALLLSGYRDRWSPRDAIETAAFEARLRVDLGGSTLVAANPHFDASFLAARWGVTPWHHRLLDVEAYAMGALGHDLPKGLATIAETLSCKAPDHTATQDVYTLRACFRHLQERYRSMPRWTS